MIIYSEKGLMADDLAMALLDLQLDEAGYERIGPNLFLLAEGRMRFGGQRGCWHLLVAVD